MSGRLISVIFVLSLLLTSCIKHTTSMEYYPYPSNGQMFTPHNPPVNKMALSENNRFETSSPHSIDDSTVENNRREARNNINQAMDQDDRLQVARALKNNPTNHISKWKNNTTHISYTIAPTSSLMTYQGHKNCRRYYSKLESSNNQQRAQGISCLSEDGTWNPIS